VLRAPRLEDAAVLAAMMTPTISRGLGAWPVPFTVAMATERIGEALRAKPRDLRCPASSNEARMRRRCSAGSACRGRIRARRATLGYWLGEAHHGCGYMREAAPALIALALRTFDLDAVERLWHGPRGRADDLRAGPSTQRALPCLRSRPPRLPSNGMTCSRPDCRNRPQQGRGMVQEDPDPGRHEAATGHDQMHRHWRRLGVRQQPD